MNRAFKFINVSLAILIDDNCFQDILGNSSFDIRLRRKAVSLVSDLAKCQLENMHKVEPPLFRDRFFLKSVVDLTASADLDLQEKVFLEHVFCGLVFCTCPCIVRGAVIVAEYIYINFSAFFFKKKKLNVAVNNIRISTYCLCQY